MLKISTWGGLIIIAMLILPLLLIGWGNWQKTAIAFAQIDEQEETTVSSQETAHINQWIANNGLNHYGDRKGIVYAGGSPPDRYLYILKKHPDKPWSK